MDCVAAKVLSTHHMPVGVVFCVHGLLELLRQLHALAVDWELLAEGDRPLYRELEHVVWAIRRPQHAGAREIEVVIVHLGLLLLGVHIAASVHFFYFAFSFDSECYTLSPV